MSTTNAVRIPKRKRPKEYKVRNQELFHDLVSRSLCEVTPRTAEDGSLQSVIISFSGRMASNLPSCNKRSIHARTSRGGYRVERKIGWNNDAQTKLAAMTDLYARALMERNGHMNLREHPSFGAESVHVQILIGKKPGRWDSHNTPKAVADWLEYIGLIKDDSRAQVWPCKKSDYGFHTDATTQIVVTLFGSARGRASDFIGDIVKIARGG